MECDRGACNSGNILARYTEGEEDEPFAELRATTTSYYEQDGINSVTSLTNPAGALVNTYSFDSFVSLTGSTGSITNPFRFTGREFDAETGIYFYRARYYDQNVGWFNSEDPIGFNGGNNFYRYALNNPLIFTDPSGKAAGAACGPCRRWDHLNVYRNRRLYSWSDRRSGRP